MAAPVALGSVDTAHKMSLAEEDDDCDADCARFKIAYNYYFWWEDQTEFKDLIMTILIFWIVMYIVWYTSFGSEGSLNPLKIENMCFFFNLMPLED